MEIYKEEQKPKRKLFIKAHDRRIDIVDQNGEWVQHVCSLNIDGELNLYGFCEDEISDLKKAGLKIDDDKYIKIDKR